MLWGSRVWGLRGLRGLGFGPIGGFGRRGSEI